MMEETKDNYAEQFRMVFFAGMGYTLLCMALIVPNTQMGQKWKLWWAREFPLLVFRNVSAVVGVVGMYICTGGWKTITKTFEMNPQPIGIGTLFSRWQRCTES